RGPGERGAAVLRAVVGDDHLARDLVLVEDAESVRHALDDVLGLVQARDDDGDAKRLELGRRCNARELGGHDRGISRSRPQSYYAFGQFLAGPSPFGWSSGHARYARWPVRICIVYDCLYPHTVGGAERWYRNLSERLADEGHDVTYLTLRQW